MRRPTRTRRLSITAIVSLLVFAAMATAYVRSYRVEDIWVVGPTVEAIRSIIFLRGHVFYSYDSIAGGNMICSIHSSSTVWPSTELSHTTPIIWSFAGFFEQYDLHPQRFCIAVPFWFPLLLLLIIPVRWLIARPANAPAFLVITEAKQKQDKTLQ